MRLEEVADVRLVDSPDVIEREGVFRRIDVTAAVSGRSRERRGRRRQGASSANMDFPLEYRAELLGTTPTRRPPSSRLLWLGAFAALGMVLLLQAAFGSWRLGVAVRS